MKLGLNVGSGQRRFHDEGDWKWTNVDINPKWQPDIVADGAHMPMFWDNSVDLVVSHHCLEHYGCGEGAPMLNECHRILKPNGSLLVFVPDMRALAQKWLTRQMTDQIYFTNVYGAYMDDEADRHKWGFSRESLTDALVFCRFIVKSFDWREIPGALLAKDFWILALEATK